MALPTAACMASKPTWEEALEEALRLNRVCRQKFGPPTRHNPHVWTYRVRRRPFGRHHVRWQVYTPTGRIPKPRP